MKKSIEELNDVMAAIHATCDPWDYRDEERIDFLIMDVINERYADDPEFWEIMAYVEKNFYNTMP